MFCNCLFTSSFSSYSSYYEYLYNEPDLDGAIFIVDLPLVSDVMVELLSLLVFDPLLLLLHVGLELVVQLLLLLLQVLLLLPFLLLLLGLHL